MEITPQKISAILRKTGMESSKTSKGRITYRTGEWFKITKLGKTEYRCKGRGYKTFQKKTYTGEIAIQYVEGTFSTRYSIETIKSALTNAGIEFEIKSNYYDADCNHYETAIIVK